MSSVTDSRSANTIVEVGQGESWSEHVSELSTPPEEPNFCRICFLDSRYEAFLTPCLCKGSIEFVHRSCLEKWLELKNSDRCELCHFVFQTRRSPRYSLWKAITNWIKNPDDLTEPWVLLRDVMVCAIVLPYIGFMFYWTIKEANYYNLTGKNYFAITRMTIISLSLVFIYGVWLFISLRQHTDDFMTWRKTHYKVEIIFPDQAPNGQIVRNLTGQSSSTEIFISTDHENSSTTKIGTYPDIKCFNKDPSSMPIVEV